MSWNRSDIDLSQLWQKDDEVYRVVAICEYPTVTLENLATSKRETHAIPSRNFAEFVRLLRKFSDGSGDK